MIRHVRDLRPGERLHADVCVVGAGIAGIGLARQLVRRGLRVTLLEAGGFEHDTATQALARVESVGKPLREPGPESGVTPYLPPVYRGETRVRQLGGTSNVWTGKWRRFDALDFAERPWIPHSGWPLRLDELDPWYEGVAREHGLGDFDEHDRSVGLQRLRGAVEPAGLSASFHYWAGEPARFGRDFRPELESADGLTVVLGANATELAPGGDGRRVESVSFRSLEGLEGRVTAESFVLAAGGLETARLLLASGGIGDGRGLVGRFFMEHPKHKGGRLRPGPTWELVGDLAPSARRPALAASFSLAGHVQRELELPNHALYFRPRGRGRLGTLLRRGVECGVSMYLEQVPNPESRVFLSAERDGVGVPKLVVDWRLTDDERAAFRRLVPALEDACAAAGLGSLELGSVTLDDTMDAAHHLGTTRMAATPAEGVVDCDCRVFGTENLFVAGGSVFPTGHSLAPTMTILALAHRLAAHLAERAAT